MDDLISRKQAIDAINTWDKFGVDERGRIVRWNEGLEPYVHLRDVLTAIVNLSSAQQWIPCSERLPNPNELNGNVIKYYLVQNVFGDMLVCNWDGKEWGLIYSYESEMPEDVVAWMPLPEPYKGEGNETD